ncbi:MAG: hypothetical protein H0T54_06605 [Geodermatophilaceae bacterium]|nr:hypothetical protein [Geodermatophilaceae bacterium]
MTYREAGASWRPLWITLAVLAAAVLLDVLLPGPDHVLAWFVAIPLVAGVFALSVLAGRRVWSVEIVEDNLCVGHDRLALSTIDAGHLQSLIEGGDVGGVETGAQVLGGGWSVPKGRVGLPLRRTDGGSLLVPTRDPAALSRALLARLKI